MLVNQARHRLRGFTLVELVTTISILAILAAIAAPSFRSFITNQRLRNASFDLMASLTLARSQAVTLGQQVMLTPKDSAWNAGWVVCKRDTGTGDCEQKTDVLATYDDHGPLSSLKITSDLDSIIYGKDGRLVAAPGAAFTVEPLDAIKGVAARCINIHLSGKPSTNACP